MNFSPDAYPGKEEPSRPRIMEFNPTEDGQSVELLFDSSVTSRDFELTLKFIQPDKEIRQSTKDRLLRYLVEKNGILDNRPVRLYRKQTDITHNAKLEELPVLIFRERPSYIELSDVLMGYYDDEEAVTATKNQIIHDAIDHGLFGKTTLTITNYQKNITINDDSIANFFRDLEG